MKLWPMTLLLFVNQALAEEVTKRAGEVDPISSAYLIKLTIGLLIIVVLIFVLAWAMKKMRLTQFSQSGLIKIVSAISVGHRDRIAVIEVGDEQILVGLTPGKINKLHTLKSKIDIPDSSVTPQAFSNKFKQLMQQGRNHAE